MTNNVTRKQLFKKIPKIVKNGKIQLKYSIIADNGANCIADKLGLSKVINELPFMFTREDVNQTNLIKFTFVPPIFIYFKLKFKKCC